MKGANGDISAKRRQQPNNKANRKNRDFPIGKEKLSKKRNRANAIEYPDYDDNIIDSDGWDEEANRDDEVDGNFDPNEGFPSVSRNGTGTAIVGDSASGSKKKSKSGGFESMGFSYPVYKGIKNKG